jgi:hypothetical protein
MKLACYAAPLKDSFPRKREGCYVKYTKPITYIFVYVHSTPSLWSSGHNSWLHARRCWVQFQALPDILNSRESGMVSTQPRFDN